MNLSNGVALVDDGRCLTHTPATASFASQCRFTPRNEITTAGSDTRVTAFYTLVSRSIVSK